MENKDLIVGKDNLSRTIDVIRKGQKQFVKDLHVIAVSIINHIEIESTKETPNNDATYCDSLMDSLASKNMKKALRDYFEAFGRIRYDEKKKRFRVSKNKTTDLTTAMTITVHAFEPEASIVKFDLYTLLQSALNRTDKRRDEIDSADTTETADELLEKTEINPQLLKELQAVAKKFAPIEVTKEEKQANKLIANINAKKEAKADAVVEAIKEEVAKVA